MTRLNSQALRAARTAAPARAALAGSALAAAAVLGLSACSGGAIGQATPGGAGYVKSSYDTTVYRPGSRPAAPAVNGTTLTGRRLALAGMRGSVVVLNFWGSWCPPCRREAPVLAALARRFSADGVRFVGVDVRDSVPSAEAFERDFGIGYPSLRDPGGQIALAFHGTVPPQSFPTTLVIDRTGHIAASVFGEVSYPGLRGLLRQVLAGRS